MGRVRTEFEKSIDARHEGFGAVDAMREHNAEKTKAIHKSTTTKVGLKMYSDKELEEKGGPVVEYNYNEPYTWEEFKAMPDDNKRQYIKFLKEKYEGIAASDIAAMMGVSDYSVCKAFGKLGIKPNKKGALTMEKRKAKRRFHEEMVGGNELVVSETVTQPEVVEYILLSASFTCDAEYVASTVKSLGMTGMVRVSVEMI